MSPRLECCDKVVELPAMWHVCDGFRRLPTHWQLAFVIPGPLHIGTHAVYVHIHALPGCNARQAAFTSLLWRWLLGQCKVAGAARLSRALYCRRRAFQHQAMRSHTWLVARPSTYAGLGTIRRLQPYYLACCNQDLLTVVADGGHGHQRVLGTLTCSVSKLRAVAPGQRRHFGRAHTS